MRHYFEKMTPIGKKLTEKDREQNSQNAREVAQVDTEISQAVEKRKRAGIPIEKIHKRGEKAAWERIDLLVDPGTFLPLNSLYDPEFNQEGSTGVWTGIRTSRGSSPTFVWSAGTLSTAARLARTRTATACPTSGS